MPVFKEVFLRGVALVDALKIYIKLLALIDTDDHLVVFLHNLGSPQHASESDSAIWRLLEVEKGSVGDSGEQVLAHGDASYLS